MNGTTYAYNADSGQMVSLNLSNGNTSFVSNVDPEAGRIYGAVSPVPEPASFVLVFTEIAAIAGSVRRRFQLR